MRLLALLILVSALATATAFAQEPAPAAPGEALFVLSGRGYGHGVGMSQYGAYGQANAGRTYDEILAHYYTGTAIGRSTRSDVRVLLAEGRPAVTVSSTVPFTARDGAGVVHKLPAGRARPPWNPQLATRDGSKVKAVPPLLVRPGKATPLSFDGRQYRGKLEIAPQGRFLRTVNVVPLESYLEGVVANEMPHTWPLEALKAQAVAARSYALANLVKGKPFDLYSDVRSQVYAGVDGEQPRSSEAVGRPRTRSCSTAARLATTYYCSSSGGRTASALDVFGFDVPYLVSKPDPWDKASPYHRWGPILFGARTLQSKLGVDARVLDAAGAPTPSGRLRSFTLQTVDGPDEDAGRAPADEPRAPLDLGHDRRPPARPAARAGRLRRRRAAHGHRARSRRARPRVFARAAPSWTRGGPLERETSGVASLVVEARADAALPDRGDRRRLACRCCCGSPRASSSRKARPTSRRSREPFARGCPAPPSRSSGGEATAGPRSRRRMWTTRARSASSSTCRPGSYRARVPATGGFAEGVAAVLVVTG